MKTILECRRLGLLGFNALTRFMAGMGMSRMRVNGKRLGDIIYPFVEGLVHFGLPETIEVNGMMMHHATSDGRGRFGWLYPFDYEPETKQMFEKIIRPGMNIVDVGAHIGYYTLLSAKLLKGRGKVYTFEPDPSCFSLLAKNIQINCLDGSVEAFQLAVAENKRTTALFLGKSTGTSLFKVPDSTGQMVTAEAVSLDEFFSQKGWPSIHLIKVDIEGSENLALQGMRTLLEKNPGLKLIIEFNPTYLKAASTQPEAFLAMLSELGFNEAVVLSREMPQYKIPMDTSSLVELAQRLNYVNLLCEKNSVALNSLE